MNRIDIKIASFEDIQEYGFPTAELHDVCKCLVFVAYSGSDKIFMAGVSMPWKGFGEVWLRPGPCLKKYLLAAKYARDLIDFVTVKYKLRRVQAQVDKTNIVNIRFMEWLGFKKECEFVEYGPNGETYMMMRRK